jgi:hypothetical protein
MIVSIHQPNFLPWLGYFHKMARADTFVLLDTVAFTKGSYINRVQVKTANGPRWLTVPVQTAGKLGQRILEVRCDDTIDWRKKIAGVLDANYRNSAHYRAFAGEILGIINSTGDNLAELNIRLVECLAGKLGISTLTIRSSRMQAQGKATDLLINICRELGADTYLSGSGGANYQEEEEFRAAGIKLVYIDFKHPTYPQLYGGFISGLTSADLLFNCGPDSRSILGL